MSIEVVGEVPEIEIIPRDKWKPHPMPRPPDFLKTPVIAVYWTKTETKECKDEESCFKVINENQLHHLKGGHFDIPYHFLIGGDGRIYEGRGWDWGGLEPYTHKSLENQEVPPLLNKSLVIAHIGRRIIDDPENIVTKATMKLIDYGIKKNLITSDYETIKRKYWIKYNKPPKPEPTM